MNKGKFISSFFCLVLLTLVFWPSVNVMAAEDEPSQALTALAAIISDQEEVIAEKMIEPEKEAVVLSAKNVRESDFVSWNNLTDFPALCPAGQFVTAVGNTLTCAVPTGGQVGAGTVNYLSKWNSGGTLGNSVIFDDGVNLGIGTTAPNANLHVNGSFYFQGGNGDVNNSGTVTSLDALTTNYFMVGLTSLTPQQYARANVTGSGVVTTFDANVTQMAVVNQNFLASSSVLIKRAVGRTIWPKMPSSWDYDWDKLGYGLGWIPSLNSEAISISNQGLVGIGTTTPSQQLEITKNFQMPNTISTTTGELYKGGVRFLHNYGTDNLFIGANSGNFSTVGYRNLALGLETLQYNNYGYANVAIGAYALQKNVNGFQNIAIGQSALKKMIDGTSNIAIGANALSQSTDGSNFAIGNYALANAVGTTFVSGSNNLAIGNNSLRSNTSGYTNLAIGQNSLFSNIAGMQNVAIGFNALRYSTNSNNLAIGYNTAANAYEVPFPGFPPVPSLEYKPSSSVFIGNEIVGLSANETNVIVIGHGVDTAGSNSVVIGNNNITKTILKGNVGLGTTVADSARLVINGGVNNYAIDASNYRIGNVGTPIAANDAVNKIYLDSALFSAMNSMASSSFWAGDLSANIWSTNSGNLGLGTTAPVEKLQVAGNVLADSFLSNADAKGKNNIRPLAGSVDKVMKIRGVSYEQKNNGEKGLGLIAQEIEKVLPELVKTSAVDGTKSIQYGNLTAVLIEAVKTQQTAIKAQQTQIDTLRLELETLRRSLKR